MNAVVDRDCVCAADSRGTVRFFWNCGRTGRGDFQRWHWPALCEERVAFLSCRTVELL